MTAVEPPRKHASLDTIVAAIRAHDKDQRRVLIGIAGPPGAGKSTLAAKLATRLGAQAAVLPMDGYHLDNTTLTEMGLLDRKGAPQTFDSSGFVQLVRTLRQGEDVSYPTFDRDQDKTISDGGHIDGGTGIVLIEGNYLLLQQSPWSDLKPLFDLTIFLDVPKDVLKSRLVARWQKHGLSDTQAETRAEENDMKNVELVLSSLASADFLTGEEN